MSRIQLLYEDDVKILLY